MNDKITLCFDREFAETLNNALQIVLSIDEESILPLWDDDVSEPLDDLHLVLNIRLNNQVV